MKICEIKETKMTSSVKIAEIKIEEVCRTCLSKETELHSVFDVYLGTITLDYVVGAITGVKVRCFSSFLLTIDHLISEAY